MYGNAATMRKGAQGVYKKWRAQPEVILVLTNGGRNQTYK